MRQRFDEDWSKQLIEEISGYDRYQSSQGIMAAANVVAAAAEEAGIADVKMHVWRSDGARRWWTFAGPPPWTPRSATLHISDASGCKIDLRYPSNSCLLAAYSCRTPPNGIAADVVRQSELGSSAPPRDSIVLLDAERTAQPRFEELERAGISGVLCGPATGGNGLDDVRRRVELPFQSTIFAFSLTATEMKRLRGSGEALTAMARVDTDEVGGMPVVTGAIGGKGRGELLMLSHLCHPRPSANDNASGVAANLAIGRCLAGTGIERSQAIRFLWAPEFVGTAAYLHDLVLRGSLETPFEAVNLDIVGQRTTLNIEHPPAHVGALFPATIERCLAAYDSAEPESATAWRAAPFTGLSDHLLLVDPAVSIPATLVGQYPDEFNHSSGDIPARVDMRSLQRTVVAVAAATELLSRGPDIQRLQHWLLSSMRRRVGADPFGRADYAIECLARNSQEALYRYGGEISPRSKLGRLQPPTAGGLERRWQGPFNLRAMVDDLPRDSRQRLEQVFSHDRRASFSAAVALAMEIDGRRSAASVIRRSAALSAQPHDPEFAQGFLAALHLAKWVGRRET